MPPVWLTTARIASAEVAGPGFLNLRLEPETWGGVVRESLATPGYGRSGMGAGQRVNVEFVSANPTGPLHVAHGRHVAVGDALASLLDHAGYASDARVLHQRRCGAQGRYARAVGLPLRYLEAHGQAVEFADGTYPG